MYLIFKLCNRTFELQYELMDYVNWWNHFRKHGKLGYQSPVNYRLDWKLKQAI
nr:IS3 family transposase [Lactococcus formosensis]